MRAGRPINEDRQNAIALGLRIYTGTRHARCGTDIRYVAGGGCVHCARIIATEQRDALKYLKAHQSEGYAEAEAAEDGFEEIVIDSAEEDELQDAEAREQAAIDDLM